MCRKYRYRLTRLQKRSESSLGLSLLCNISATPQSSSDVNFEWLAVSCVTDISRKASQMSRLLVSPRIGFKRLVSKPKSGQRGRIRGAVNVPNPVIELHKTLPRCRIKKHSIPDQLFRH